MAYRTVITIPKTQSQEKISLLLTVGAEVLTVPEKPYSDLILTTASHRDSRKEKGWFWANQFDNIANRLLRYRTTVPGAPAELVRSSQPSVQLVDWH